MATRAGRKRLRVAVAACAAAAGTLVTGLLASGLPSLAPRGDLRSAAGGGGLVSERAGNSQISGHSHSATDPGASRASGWATPIPTAAEAELALRNLMAARDAALAAGDEGALRAIYAAGFSGLTEELEIFARSRNAEIVTSVSDIRTAETGPGYALLSATFGFARGPQRSLVYLTRGDAGWKIAGVQATGPAGPRGREA